MAQTNRSAAQVRIARSQAIRRDRRLRTVTALPAVRADDAMPADLLAACVAAGGFDRNDALGY